MHKFAKSTFKSTSAIGPLVALLGRIIPKLQKLLSFKILRKCTIDEIYSICKKLPTVVQRSQHVHRQVHIFQEMERQVHLCNSPNAPNHQKTYALYLLWKRVEDIIVNRIRSVIKGHLQHLSSNPDHFKLFTFLKEIQSTSEHLHTWAALQSKKLNRQEHKTLTLITPKTGSKVDATTNRFTSASTGLASCMPSHHDQRDKRSYMPSHHEQRDKLSAAMMSYNEQRDTPQGMERIFKHSGSISQLTGLRASTAKLERKELKMSIRCPSAAQLLKHSAFKKPHFQYRNADKSKRKSIDDQEQASRVSKIGNQKIRFKSECLALENNFLYSQGHRSNKQNEINLSMLEMQGQELQRKQRSKKSKGKCPSIDLISNEGVENELDKQTSLSQSRIPKEGMEQQQENIQSEQFVKRRQYRKPTVYSSNANANQFQQKCFKSDSQSSNGSSSDLEMKFKIKSRKKVLKKVRRSGQYIVKIGQQWVKAQPSIQPKKILNNSHNSRRRVALLNTSHKLTSKGVLCEDEIPEQRCFDFDQDDVLLATSNPRKGKQNKRNKVQGAKSSTGNTFGNLLGQLHNFIDKDQFLYQYKYGSIFFLQQQRLRQAEDVDMKERLKHLTKDQRQVYSNIFEMSRTTSLNKDVIYSQIHRKETFSSDNQWIRNAFGVDQPLLQQPL